MPNQIQVELDGKTINLTVSDDQMSIVSDDGREFKATGFGEWNDCAECAFSDLKSEFCRSIPCIADARGDDETIIFIELT